MAKLRDLNLLYFTEDQVNKMSVVLDALEIKPSKENSSSWDSGGGHEHAFFKLPSGYWIGFHCVTDDITLTFIPYENDCKLYDDFWTVPDATTGIYLTEEGSGFEHNAEILSLAISKHVYKMETIINMINWSEISRKITGNPDNIRGSKITRGQLPNKYRGKVFELIQLVFNWDKEEVI